MAIPLSLENQNLLYQTGNWVEKGDWTEWEVSAPCSSLNGTCGEITKSRKCKIIENGEPICTSPNTIKTPCYRNATCGTFYIFSFISVRTRVSWVTPKMSQKFETFDVEKIERSHYVGKMSRFRIS